MDHCEFKASLVCLVSSTPVKTMQLDSVSKNFVTPVGYKVNISSGDPGVNPVPVKLYSEL